MALETYVPQRGALTLETLHDGDVLGWSWLVAPVPHRVRRPRDRATSTPWRSTGAACAASARRTTTSATTCSRASRVVIVRAPAGHAASAARRLRPCRRLSSPPVRWSRRASASPIGPRRPRTRGRSTSSRATPDALPDFAPGQFAMLYAFGVGEVPISVSGDLARRRLARAHDPRGRRRDLGALRKRCRARTWACAARSVRPWPRGRGRGCRRRASWPAASGSRRFAR